MPDSEKVTTTIMVDGQPIPLDAATIRGLFARGARTVQINVSYSRRLNTDNFQGEEFGITQFKDVSHVWEVLPIDFFLDTELSKEVSQGFYEASRLIVGKAVRAAYVDALSCVYDRASALKLPWLKNIRAEVDNLGKPESFDPFDVRGIRRQES